MGDDDPNKKAEAEAIIQGNLAVARRLLEESMRLADQHMMVIPFGLIDGNHYFPKGFTVEGTNFSPWCGVAPLVERIVKDGGQWLHSGEYGDCD